MNATKNKFNQDMCCVVFTMPDEIQQSDLACQASDAERDLDLGLESNDEQVISSLITIKPTNDNKITFQMPTRVYVPVVSYNQKLDAKLKFMINGKDKWRTGRSLQDVQLPGVSNVTFVGVEIPMKTLKYVECIAVARYKRYEIEVDTYGKIFEPEGDRNIKVKFPPKSFPGKTTVATKTIPWTHRDIKHASKKFKELPKIKTAGSYIDISCENSTKEVTELEMYDFGWVVEKNQQKHQSVTQETLNRCSRWLVNNMNPDENALQLDDVFDSDFIGEIKTEESQGDKNRHILRTLHDVSDSDFDKFVFCLNVSQPEVANRVRDVREQVKLSRKSNDTNYEDNFASDFDPDFERKEGTVGIVSKLTGKTWEIVSIEASNEHPKARFVKLLAGSDQFRVLGLVVPEGMSHEDICRAAEILEGLNCVTNVSVICRQKHANPHDVIIECVRSENVADTIRHLDALGYNDGPPESSDVGVVDREEIEIKVAHNLRLEGYRNSSLKLKFYKNIASERYSGHLAVVNKKDQWEDERYHLSYNVSYGRLSMPRCGKMILYVPKPLDEIVRSFPYTIDVPVKALAKFISWQLTKDNFNSTKWVKHAGYLTDLDKHLYHQIVKYIDNEIPGAPQRGRCELFIMYWANNHAQFDPDKMPTRVYVPVVSYNQKLDAKLKFMINGKDKWRTGRSLQDVQLPGVSNVTFVGVEIPMKTLKYVECIAVARYKRYEIEVDTYGKIFEPEGDRNIKVKFPPKSFPGKTTVATKTIPWTHRDIKHASKKFKELPKIKTAGSYIDISCENSTKEVTELEMYDFGWVVEKNQQKHQSVTQETLNRCSRWLVNNMNPDENALQLDDVFDSDFIGEIKTEESQGDKNRHILRTLHDVSDSDFDKFVFCLNVSQPEVANRVRDVREQVKLSRKSNDTNYEDNFASDFDPDFERKEGTVCIVSKLTGKTWEIVSIEASNEHPKARFVKLPAGSDQFRVLGLVVPEGMSHEDICRAAEILEGLNCVTNVSVICGQKHANSHDVIIECVISENVADTIRHLDALGYNDGPPEGSDVGVVDGEEIEIKVAHNLRLEGYRNSSLKLKFYKNIASERYSGHLAVVNKKDQWEDERYHGYLSYNVSYGRLSMPRCGKMILYVPKPLEEIVRSFPYTIDVPVKALAKFISWQLTKDNFDSTKWVKHAGYLTDLDKHLYHQIVKYIDNEIPRAPQRGRCELYIMYWANNHAQFDPDKIGKIIAAHHDERLENEAQQFIKPYVPGKGLLSNDNLEKMAYAVAKDWENMAKKPGFSSDEINEIKSSQHVNVRQSLRMLDVWRVSSSAIQKGTNLVKSLHETAKSAQCGAKFLSMISNHV